MIKFLILFLFPIFLLAIDFSVATYNIENLFDTKKNGNEYKEYIPNTKSGWNDEMLNIKIKNIVKVVKDIDADIIALQELENITIAKRLNLALGSKKYPYMYSNFRNKGIDSVLFSRYPIKFHKSFNINSRFRPIHKVVVNVKGLHVNFFLNHWPSYKNGNAKRMEFAKALEKIYKKDKNYIILGDFNSPLVKDKRNWGEAVNYISKDNTNLWYDLPKKDRYSHVFFKDKNALDHIIISKNINYKEGSFIVFKPQYLLNKYKQPNRWLISQKGKGQHLGIGYSDHFALKATFSTHKINKPKVEEATIKMLLHTQRRRVNFLLKDVMVIDATKYGVTIEDKNRDKIYMYQPDINLEVGKIYNLHIKELATYKGNKEIVLVDFNYNVDKISD